MDKKRPTAKLKKKGAYLPDQPEAEVTEATGNVVPLQGTSAVSTPTRTYRRARWKHYIRYLALLGLIVVDCSFVSSAIRVITSHTEITVYLLSRLCMIYLIMLLSNLMFLPSIVLESDSVEVGDDGLTMKSLLYTAKVPWSDVKRVTNPLFLKFAIIRTPRFFQLINKRGIEGFDELIQTIQMKAEKASK
jgi:hypothetical protein